jgi:predicted DNA-binding transcriptional regulator AlpA
MGEELLRPAVVAEHLGTTTAALANMRYRGTGPKFIKVSAKAIRYRPADVNTWLDAQTMQQTGEQVPA